MNFQTSSFSFADAVRQPTNFGYFGGMNSSYLGMGQVMKLPKMGDYNGMMNLDFVPPTMDPSHRINEMRPRPNTFMHEPMMNFESRSMNGNICYDSADSDEESKGLGNKRDDELFLHPYSSIIRKKESSLMPSGYPNEFKEINYDTIKPENYSSQRYSEAPQRNRIDKPLLPRMPKY